MTVLKKCISCVLVLSCILSANAVAFADTAFIDNAIEIDQSADVYSFSDSFERDADFTDTTKTGINNVLDSNWSSKSTGSMDGDGTGTTTFGFDGQDLSVSFFKQDTYPKISTSQSTKMAGFNWTASHSELSSQFVIKTSVKKSHNVNMWGIRFMQHNDEQNYYMLFLGGQYSYQLTSGVISWGLYKVENGAVSILKEQMQTEDESRKFIGTAADAELTLTYDNGKIDFNVAYNGDESYYSGTYTDTDEPYILSGDEVGIQLVASSCGSSAYPIYFRNFSVSNYVPYITAGEPDNVIYNNVARYAKFSNDNVADFYRAYPVRKIKSISLANAEVDVYLSVDGENWDKITGAQFDSNGVWLNNKTQKAYRYLYFDSLDKNDLNVYTDISKDYVYDAVVTDAVDLVAVSGGICDPSLYEWTVSNDTMAEIDFGILNILRRKGTVEITAVNDDVTLGAVFNIIGEMEMAERNNTVSQYMNEKKPVIDAVNTALNNNNFEDFKAFFRDEGEIKIGSIVDLDTAKITSLSDDKLLTLFNRLITYDDFKCSIPQDLYDFSDILDKEYAVGELCNIATVTDFETSFKTNNEYIGLDTENFYFENYKSDVFGKLLNIQFASCSDFINKYNEAMISISYKKALSYVMVKNFIEFFPEVIGYNEEHYDDVKGDNLYKQILDKKDTLDTIEKLRQYIDGYTKPATPPVVDRPSLGGGGGGGGGAVSSKPDTSFMVIGEENQVAPPLEITPVKVIAFDDVDSEHWAYDSIVVLKNANIINGYNDGCFYPENKVTRAEFVKILVGARKIEINDEEESFADVSKDDWFAPYAAAAKKTGIVQGDGDNFNGNTYISRQEMAVMIYRSLNLTTSENADGPGFDDDESIAQWAMDAVTYLKNKNIVTGYNNMFNPLDSATRAEVAHIVSRVIQED